MAHPNIDQRQEAVGKVLSAGIEIKEREAKVLSVLYNCSPSAIRADTKVVRVFGSAGDGAKISGGDKRG